MSSRLASTAYTPPTAPPTAQQVANAVWNEPTTAHTAAGSFGANLDAAVSSRLAATTYVVAPTTAAIATAVWNDSKSTDFNVVGSAGAKLMSLSGSIDPWSVTLPGNYAAGTAGAILGKNLDAAVSTRSTYNGGPVAGVTAPVTVGTNNDKGGYSLAPSGLDGILVEDGINARQALSPILAAAAGSITGAGSGTVVIKGGNSAVTRIMAATDAAGNRSSVTLSLPT